MAKCDINNKQRLFDVLKSKDIVNMANDNNIEYSATLSGSILNVSVKSGVDNAYIVQSLIENAVNNSFPGILLSSRTEDGYINTILFTERVNNTIKDKRNKRIAKLRFDRSIVRNDGEVISPSGYPAIPMANDRNGIIKNLEKQIHQEATNAWDLGEVADVSNRGVGKLINEYYKSDVVSYYDEGTDLTFPRVQVPEFLVDIYYNELLNIIKERKEKWSNDLMEQSSFWNENGDVDQYNSISTTNTNIGSKALGFNDFIQDKPGSVKSGVKELFNENPELANVGTQEQYSQYLDTIFPDSKVKDIVYHSTRRVYKSFKGGIYSYFYDIDGDKTLLQHKQYSKKEKEEVLSNYLIDNKFKQALISLYSYDTELSNLIKNASVKDIKIVDYKPEIPTFTNTFKDEKSKYGKVISLIEFTIDINGRRTSFFIEYNDVKGSEHYTLIEGNNIKSLDNFDRKQLNDLFYDFFNLYKQSRRPDSKDINYRFFPENTLEISETEYINNFLNSKQDPNFYIEDINHNPITISNAELGTGFYVSSSRKNIPNSNGVNANIYPMVVNIKAPYRVKGYGTEVSNKSNKPLIDNGFDSVITTIRGAEEIAIFDKSQIHILGSKQDIEGFKDFVQGKQYQKLTAEEKAKTVEQVTKEHRSIAALKDLSAKLAWRIGGKVEFDNKTDVDWKGYNQGMTSVLNEAYMTSDTPFHEILAHPIIRAIKNKNLRTTSEGISDFSQSKLYQSLLKELETSETGRKVFEQVKRDYVSKQTKYPILERVGKVPYGGIYEKDGIIYSVNGKDFFNKDEAIKFQNNNLDFSQKYTLEEQQEEAIVTLLGMMAADKLDAKKDATLISKLKELWKQISDFVKSLLTGNISENEISNIIENEVTYTDEENKPCAKDGIRSSKFTKGSQWEIVKDLKGYPSHAQGGVDIKLGKDGFSFTGKDGEIKAANGLVLPKIK